MKGLVRSLLNRLVGWKSDPAEVDADPNIACLSWHFCVESNLLTAPAIKEDVGEDKGELTK